MNNYQLKMAAKLNLLTIFTFILLGLFFARSVSPTTDTYWHLAIGKQIWEEKQIPKTDQFIYGPTDNRFTSTEWLAALLFYGAVRYFDFEGLVALRVILGLTTIYLLYLTIKLITQNVSVQLLTCVIVGYTLATRLFDRPENFSFLFLALVNYSFFYSFFYYFLSKTEVRQKLPVTCYLLPVTFLAWPNIHPLVVVGMAILAVFTVILVLERTQGQKNLHNLKRFLVIALLSFLAAIIQYKRFFYFLFTSQVSGFRITEFMSLRERLWQTEGFDLLNSISAYSYIYFAICLLYLISIFYFLKSKPKPSFKILLLFYLVMLLLPIKLYRLIQMTVLIAFPQLVLTVKIAFANRIPGFAQPFLNFLLLAQLLIIAASAISGDIIGSKEQVSLISFASSSDAPAQVVGAVYRFWKPLFPTQAEQIISSHLRTKRLFTSNFWSSYFIWYNPKIKVFADVMHEYRTQEDFRQEKTLETGGNGWQELLTKHDIDTVVNSQFFVFYPNNTPVYTLPDWKLVYLDDNAIIWARNDVVKSVPVDLSAIQPELPTGLKFKPEDEKVALSQLEALLVYDPKNGFARGQLTQYYLDHDLVKAKQLAEQSRKLLPKDPLPSLHLAIIYARENNCNLSKEFAQEAKKKSFNNPIIIAEIKRTVGRCIPIN